jgi:membrane-associated protease RseP (regulator of RpoE activity)
VKPPPGDSTAEPIDDSQLPPRAWLMRNGIYLLIFAGLVAYIWYQMGPDGLWNIGKAALGLGFIIFVHELGHFAVAKWCDVHVQTFSLGFGPPLPGCSFTRGETTYKLAVFPLGGYVKMVGEGDDDEGSEDDPRSFKNKTVGQRMAIISAGVVMNVILGCTCFIIAFSNGVAVPPALAGKVDPGSPAWLKGLPTVTLGDAASGRPGAASGPRIKKLGSIENPNFEDLKYLVMLSHAGEKLPVEVEWPDGRIDRFEIEPRKDRFDSNPVIGVVPPSDLRLISEKEGQRRGGAPPTIGAAASARRLDLRPGDRVVATTTDPTDPAKRVDLPAPAPGESYNYYQLSRRLQEAGDKTLTLFVQRKDGQPEEEVPLPAEGFRYGDVIVGTSAVPRPGQPYDPHQIQPLTSFTLPETGERRYNYFEFSQRMQDLAGRPIVLLVQRHGTGPDVEPVPLLVPPAYHYTPGLRMRMGKIAAVRNHSPAQKVLPGTPEELAQKGYHIWRVEATDAGRGETTRFGDLGPEFLALFVPSPGGGLPGSLPLAGLFLNASESFLDPLRLPYELRRWAQGRSGVRVTLTVSRDGKKEVLEPIEWDDKWKYDREEPISARSPWAIPELGIAYHVETAVAGVEPNSSAAKAGLQKGDILLEVRFKYPGNEPGTTEWGPWVELWPPDSSAGTKKQRRWPYVFNYLQILEHKDMEVKVRRGDTDLPLVALKGEPAPDWPAEERGLDLISDVRWKKASNPVQALAMGVEYTQRTIVRVYKGLLAMMTNRLPVTENLRGPINIAKTAFEIAGHDLNTFILFCGLISVNLAVINFLPVPLLDGGHMVFLIYEKLRGRPAPARVQVVATVVGLALLASLMLLVIFLDVKRDILGLG